MLKSLLDVLLGSEEDNLNDEDEKIALAASVSYTHLTLPTIYSV